MARIEGTGQESGISVLITKGQVNLQKAGQAQSPGL